MDEQILVDTHPTGSLIGSVESEPFPAQEGVSHTFDRFKNVYPDLSRAWENVPAGSCIGTPCDLNRTKIGMGYVRDEYHLQRAGFETDIFCFEEVMTADRATQQFGHMIRNLRRCTEIIQSYRIQTEYLRFCGWKWLCMLGGLEPITAMAETGNMTDILLTGANQGAGAAPDSKLVKNMLRYRVEYQRLSGALGDVVEGMSPTIEVLTNPNLIYDLVQGDSQTTDHWRYAELDKGSREFNKFGWTAQVGDFMLRGHLTPMRFTIDQNNHLRQVFPFINIPTTQGIGEIVNPGYLLAPIQVTFIWHRKAIKDRPRTSRAVNPQMPFAAQDYAGRWQWVMDNLSCGVGVDANGVQFPIMVNNEERNKGKFIAKFSGGTQCQFPEYAEAFFHLVEPPVIIGEPLCYTPSYVPQDYNSANDPCPPPGPT